MQITRTRNNFRFGSTKFFIPQPLFAFSSVVAVVVAYLMAMMRLAVIASFIVNVAKGTAYCSPVGSALTIHGHYAYEATMAHVSGCSGPGNILFSLDPTLYCRCWAGSTDGSVPECTITGLTITLRQLCESGYSFSGGLYLEHLGSIGSCASYGYAGICSASASTTGDPHMMLPHGGRADFKGEDGKAFVLLSAPNVSFAAETTESHFQQKMGKQTVHGTHFTKAFFTLRTNITGQIVRVTVTAAITPWFSPYATVSVVGENTKPRKVAFGHGPTFELEDVSVTADSKTHVLVRTAGWALAVTRRILFKPLPTSKTRNYLNVDVKPESADPRLAHGMLGQAFGPALLGRTVEGKLDNYSAAEVSTSAQAEGAIEGVYTDYKLATPFSTTFKYSRFDEARLQTNLSQIYMWSPALVASASDEEDAVK